MAVNDKNLPNLAQGVGVYPGMANPTSSSQPNNPMDNNFVTDPTTSDVGAGAGPTFEGDKQAKRLFKQTAGVIEGEPGIIESTNVHPLRPDSNDDDGWAHTDAKTTKDAPSISERAVGGAKMAYGHVTGNEQMKREGEKALYDTK